MLRRDNRGSRSDFRILLATAQTRHPAESCLQGKSRCSPRRACERAKASGEGISNTLSALKCCLRTAGDGAEMQNKGKRLLLRIVPVQQRSRHWRGLPRASSCLHAHSACARLSQDSRNAFHLLAGSYLFSSCLGCKDSVLQNSALEIALN